MKFKVGTIIVYKNVSRNSEHGHFVNGEKYLVTSYDGNNCYGFEAQDEPGREKLGDLKSGWFHNFVEGEDFTIAPSSWKERLKA